jgi:single-strand DNA-binding protein
VYIEGRLSTRSYEDRDGNKRYTTEVVARRVVFLSTGRGAASSDAGGAATSFTGSARSEEATEQPQAAVGDELPF